MSDFILDIKNITKQFPGTLALNDVSMQVKRGEIHAICGENGAGKSTLMNILAGNYLQDAGEIYFDGNLIKTGSPKAMQDIGIGIVYQEGSLIDSLNVAENIYADRQVTNRLGVIDRKETFRNAQRLLDILKLKISPRTSVGRLPQALKQMVEIAKAISLNPKVLILDEPTSAITENETRVLFDVIRDLKKNGLTIIYISHRLAEIFEIADRVSVLKDGSYICTKNISETNINDIIVNMVGREIGQVYSSQSVQDDTLLEVKNLTSQRFRDISFSVKKGEILTITGLSGAGRTELALAMFGADPKARGEILMEGKPVDFTSVSNSMAAGIGYMPEDRKDSGLFLGMSILDNIISGDLESVSRRGMIDKPKCREIANNYKEKLNIVAPDVKKTTLLLSGGNQQKVIIAKWLMVNPKLLIVDEPTRGVDVGAKMEIYQLLKDFVKDGRSILVISSDMAEVLSISNRIIIMAEGIITGELNRDEFDEKTILKCASGL